MCADEMIKPSGKLHPASLLSCQLESIMSQNFNKDIYTEVNSRPRAMDSLTRVTNNLSIFNSRSANLVVRRTLQNRTTRTFFVEPQVLDFLAEQRDRINNAFCNGDDFVIKRQNVGILYFSRTSATSETWMSVRRSDGPAFNLRRAEYTALKGLLPYINSAIMDVGINN